MIYHIFYPLAKYFFAFNVTRYITFRGGCAFVTAFLLVILFSRAFFAWLRKIKMLETIDMYGRPDLEKLYLGKKGTPTMGGVLMIFSIVTTLFFWCRWDNYLVWLCIFTLCFLGALGLRDDLLKTRKGKGLTRREKLLGQIVVGLVLGLFIVLTKCIPTTWDFPFFKKLVIDLKDFYIFWAALVVVAASNAVNFTDGMDGLATGGLIFSAIIFAIFSYLVGNSKFAEYLLIPYVPFAGELTIVCLAMVGAGMGFLWYNAYPAQVFMGDVGALSLGGMLGAISLLIKKEFLLVIVGGLFVLEAASVVTQIFFIRVLKRRAFKAAPFHHHLQLLGWQEPKVIVRLWIVAVMCAVLSLLTLKLR